MKISKKIVSLALAVILCLGTVFAASSAQTEVASVAAEGKLLPIGGNIVCSDIGAIVGSNIKLPASYNSNELGYVTPVRQQTDSTCWAFGSLSTFETLLLKSGEKLDSAFAPQHENFWGSIDLMTGKGWQRSATGGGYSYIPLGYLTSWSGPVYEGSFPITSELSDYLFGGNELKPQYGLTEAIYFDSSASKESIKALIYTYGAVVGSYNADLKYLANNKSHYCSDSSIPLSGLMGHCISVVGWDDNYKKENFTNNLCGTPKHDGAWLIKNSWGAKANDIGGFFWVSYDDVWIFNSIFGPSYAFSAYEKITDNKKLYQNETYGATYQFAYITSEQYNPTEEISYINIFDFTESDRILDKVIFETTSLYADYKVSYVPLTDDAPDKNKSNWLTLSTGTVDHTGYICVDIENTTLPAGKGGIAVTIDNKNAYLTHKNDPRYEYIDNCIGVGEWLKVNGNYIFIPDTQPGTSYFIRGNGVMFELSEFYKTLLNDEVGGTFVIKALTANPEKEQPTTPAETTAPSTTAPTTAAPAPTATTAAATTVTAPSTSAPAESTAPSQATTTGNTDISEHPLGDSNGDGVVNVKDATYIQKVVAGLLTFANETDHANADVNGDNSVNVKDATVIQKYVAGIDTGFLIGK